MRSGWILFLALLAMWVIPACNRAPGGTISENGLQLSYPDGWKATQREESSGAIRWTNITIEGPGNALISFTHYHSKMPLTLERYSQIFVEKREEENKKMHLSTSTTRVTPISMNVGGQQREGIRQEFDVTLVSQSVPHRADFTRLATETSTLLIMTHVPVEDLKEADAGFRAILDSVKLQ